MTKYRTGKVAVAQPAAGLIAAERCRRRRQSAPLTSGHTLEAIAARHFDWKGGLTARKEQAPEQEVPERKGVRR